jgi:hypothetical protein
MLELGSVTIIMKKKTCANPKNKNTTNSNYSKKIHLKFLFLSQDSLNRCAQMHLYKHGTLKSNQEVSVLVFERTWFQAL